MSAPDPMRLVVHAERIAEAGGWPNFHDAEVHTLNLWRGDVRPQDNVWVGVAIEAVFELCALEHPYAVLLRFEDCEGISLGEFDHRNAVYDLVFGHEARGHYNDGRPLPPWITVDFAQAFGRAFSFRCMRVEAVARLALGELPSAG
ncbi:MAG: hypothetical protein ACU85V_01875 [Gammaproteobacteria bacterium]